MYLSEKEITEGMAKQYVTEVKKISKKVNGEMIPTRTSILTFNLPRLPERVKAGFISLNVREYIPAHSSNKCKSKTSFCGKCYKTAHDEEPECTSPMFCINCSSNEHPSWARSCQKYKDEFEIQRIKVLERKSLPEAICIFEERYPQSFSAQLRQNRQEQINTVKTTNIKPYRTNANTDTNTNLNKEDNLTKESKIKQSNNVYIKEKEKEKETETEIEQKEINISDKVNTNITTQIQTQETTLVEIHTTPLPPKTTYPHTHSPTQAEPTDTSHIHCNTNKNSHQNSSSAEPCVTNLSDKFSSENETLDYDMDQIDE